MSISVQRNRALGRSGASRRAIVEDLRRLLPAMQGGGLADGALPFRLSAIDEHLPQGGLVPGALHEFTGAEPSDMPAAFGFVAMLLGRAMAESRGSGLLILSRGSLEAFGTPYGHGLRDLGLDPGRLVIVETMTDRQALWAVEEALRLRAVAAVAGTLGTTIDLKASRRLHLAAESSGVFLFLLRPPDADEANAALTRWRIAAAPAPHDRFGCFAGWRWQVGLERCRNGRPGAWAVELSHRESSHAAHSLRLAGALAHPPVSVGAGSEPSSRRAG